MANGLRGLITPFLTIEGSFSQALSPLLSPLNLAPPILPFALFDQSFGGVLANLPALPGLNGGANPIAALTSAVASASPREVVSRVGGSSNRIVSQVRRGV